ncbi:MAG: glycosyltransferase [Halobacteriales archaeon]|nr:glycosyltransferase [Halobacteriales archaeon]
MPAPRPCQLTVVLLTWNEERNIDASLDGLAKQRERDFEVAVIDAASTDRTADRVRARQADFPVPLRLEVAPTRISVGEARNRGVQLARGTHVAFLSADAVPGEGWVSEALHSLRSADMVFGRQLHDPPRWGVGAAVRGLRYHHFPSGPSSDPAKFASNVNAALRRDVVLAFPFGTSPAASAVDDLLLAQRALGAGYHAAYNPDMLVRHRDVDSARMELVKNVREGLGWGSFAAELGLNKPVLAWGVLLAFALLLLALSPSVETFLLLLLALWAPALRRAWHRRGKMDLGPMLLGVAASPPFDLAFLCAYLRGLIAAPNPNPPVTTKEMQA